MIELVPATIEHAEAIAANAREADVAELWAQARSTPLDAMKGGIKATRSATTVLLDDEPVAMFGVTPVSLLKGWGAPWLVGSARLDTMTMRKALLREAREVFAGWQRGYSFLLNFVDDRNERAKHWLAWLGFTLHETQPFGPDALPFRAFYWRSP